MAGLLRDTDPIYPKACIIKKKKIAKNVSWLLHHRANWRIVFLCSGFTLGLWNHIHCLSCFWTECQFFTLAHNTHLRCCVGSYPLAFRGCPSVTCNCRSSSSYTLYVYAPADIRRTATLLRFLPKECVCPNEAAQICFAQGMAWINFSISVSTLFPKDSFSLL